MSNETFLWLDLETTGLDSDIDTIIEAAGIVTDDELRPQGPCFRMLCSPLEGGRVNISKWAYLQHSKSGLLDEAIAYGADDIKALDNKLVRHLRDVGAGYSLILAGSNPTFDREFIRTYMPKTAQHLHSHRTLDASSLYRIAGGRPQIEERAHTALDDIKVDLEAARQARSTIRKEWGFE